MWQPHVEAPCLWNRGLCKVPSGAVNDLKLFLVSLYRCPGKAAGFLELVLYFVKIPLWASLVKKVLLGIEILDQVFPLISFMSYVDRVTY